MERIREKLTESIYEYDREARQEGRHPACDAGTSVGWTPSYAAGWDAVFGKAKPPEIPPPPWDRPPPLERNSIACPRCGSVDLCGLTRCCYEGCDGRRARIEGAQRVAMIAAAAARFRSCFERGHDPHQCPGHVS